MLNGESLFQQKSRGVKVKSFNTSLKAFAAGEGKIVSIPRINRAASLREACEPAIKTVGAEIRKRG